MICEPVIKRMKESVKFEAVLAGEKTKCDVVLDLFYVLQLNSGAKLTTLVANFSKELPLGDMTGILKRVKKCESYFQVLLFPANGVSVDEAFRRLAGYMGQIDESWTDYCITTVSVPVQPIWTRKQFEYAKSFWPVTFREDKKLEAALKGVQYLFTPPQLATFDKYMRKAIEAAKLAKEGHYPAIGAVIVDPKTDTVKAICYDVRRVSAPLQHCVMCAADVVAQGVRGGALSFQDLNPGSTLPQGWFCDKMQADPNAYLCTGYDLYITHEPCAMCAMALVHSRISRVFYSIPDPECGALGSKLNLHYQTGLNHHFEVFRQLLYDECALLMNKNNKY